MGKNNYQSISEIGLKNADKEYSYLKKEIFKDDVDYFDKLEKLHFKKLKLSQIKDRSIITEPFVIEFLGTARTGKTTMKNMIYDFFKKAGFKVKIINEFVESDNYKKEFLPRIKDLSIFEANIKIAEEFIRQLETEIHSNWDIILIDRWLIDSIIWIDRRTRKKGMTNREYKKYIDYCFPAIKRMLDMAIITYADVNTVLKREYYNSISLETRTFLNKETASEYNFSLNKCREVINKNFPDNYYLDTTKKEINENAIKIANRIINRLSKKYLASHQK